MGQTHHTTSTLSSNRLVTLPPGIYKARQGPLSHHLHHHLVNTPNQSRATQHTRRRVLRTLRPEPVSIVCHVSLPSSYRSRRGHIHLPRVFPLVGCRSKTPPAGVPGNPGWLNLDRSWNHLKVHLGPKYVLVN
jgi:hypothetical protein